MIFGIIRNDFARSEKGECDVIEDSPQDDLIIEHFIFLNYLTKGDCTDQGILISFSLFLTC